MFLYKMIIIRIFLPEAVFYSDKYVGGLQSLSLAGEDQDWGDQDLMTNVREGAWRTGPSI